MLKISNKGLITPKSIIKVFINDQGEFEEREIDICDLPKSFETKDITMKSDYIRILGDSYFEPTYWIYLK